MSPFKSEQQRKFLFAKHPDIAKRWARETPKGRLPRRKKRIKAIPPKKKG